MKNFFSITCAVAFAAHKKGPPATPTKLPAGHLISEAGGILPHCCRLTEPSSERHILQPKRENACATLGAWREVVH
jgi:hypothetical protein